MVLRVEMRTRAALVFVLAAGVAGVVLLPAAGATRPAGGTGEKPVFLQGLKGLVNQALAAEQRALLKVNAPGKAMAELKTAESALAKLCEALQTPEGKLLPTKQELETACRSAIANDRGARASLVAAQKVKGSSAKSKAKRARLIATARNRINAAIKAKNDLLAAIPAEIDTGCRVQTKTEFTSGQPTKQTFQVLNCTTPLTEIRLADGKLPSFGPAMVANPDGTTAPVTCSQNGVLSCRVPLPIGAVFSLPILGVQSETLATVLLVAAQGVSYSAAVFRPPG